MEQTTILIGLGVLIFAAYLFARLFKALTVPDVLPLFLVGLLIGPITGWIPPEALGRTGELLATFTLISVLFVGGLNIDISSLIRSFSKTFLLMFLNLLGTIVIIAGGAYYLFGVDPLAGTIVGILLGGTSAAVVIPIANRLRLRPVTRTVLSIESDLNDIFSVVVALALVGVMRQESVDLTSLPLELIGIFVTSVLLGVVVAIGWSRLLGRARLLEHNIFTTPALLLVLYGLTEFGGMVGPVTVLAFGITLGNLSSLRLAPFRPLSKLTEFRLTSQERTFFSSLMFLFKTFFFVYIGIVMPLNDPRFILWGMMVMLALYILRIIIADLLLRDSIPSYDLTVVKSMLPKGLTGGALLILIGDPTLEKLTYPVILMSIIFTAIAVFVVNLTQSPEQDSDTADVPRHEEELPPRLLPSPEDPGDPDVPHYSLTSDQVLTHHLKQNTE